VCSVVADLLRAWAQAHRRNFEAHDEVVASRPADRLKDDLDVDHARGAGDRGLLVDEVGEGQLEMRDLGVQPLFHVVADTDHLVGVQLLVVLVEHFEEAGHVRALLVVGEADKHVDAGDGVLAAAGRRAAQGDRVADVLDPDLVDGDVALVVRGLDIRHHLRGVLLGGGHQWSSRFRAVLRALVPVWLNSVN